MLQTCHLEKIKISKNILGFFGGIFEKYLKIYIFTFDWSRCTGLSICLSTFWDKISDPKSDQIYLRKIAVEMLGALALGQWQVMLKTYNFNCDFAQVNDIRFWICKRFLKGRESPMHLCQRNFFLDFFKYFYCLFFVFFEKKKSKFWFFSRWHVCSMQGAAK